MLRIRLVKSTVGHIPRNRRTVQALGLRKVRQEVLHHDTPSIRGMIHNVKELLHVEVVPDVAPTEDAPKAPKAAKAKKATTEEA